MKIQVFSDLHLEYAGNNPGALGLKVAAGVDVLVLAGDIMQWRDPMAVRETMAWFADRVETVIYVPGNHEYYSGSPDDARRALEQAAFLGPPNIEYALTPQVFSCSGKRFICGTGWYSHKSVLAIPGDPDTGFFRKRGSLYSFSDFRHIRGLVPWVYEQNDAFSKLLKDELRAGDVVVSHHLPAPQSTPSEFKHEVDNVFYVNDKSGLIRKRKPALWLHGHTHSPFDYRLGATRVVCNPRGYKAERAKLGPYVPVVVEL